MATSKKDTTKKETVKKETVKKETAKKEPVSKGDKYVAYVSTYTMGDNHGIKVYDVDMENGRFTEKAKVKITNSSYVTISKSDKYLYSITDFGVESYKILPDGMLEAINMAPINGMRGCYLTTGINDEFLFVAGYHDGKVTMLKLNKDGSVGEITDEIYHKGMGIASERSFRPHISCVKVTRDAKFLCVADLGMDHVDVYAIDKERGKLKHVDVIRSEQESGPRHIKFSKDGRFLYIVHEEKCFIDVYSYEVKNNQPYFEKIQTIPTVNDYHAGGSVASALSFSDDYNYLVSSNAGDNSVVAYEVNKETGMLKKVLCLPVSGEYPKDAALFPDDKHLVSLNHESNTMTFFNIDMEKGTLVMNGRELPVESPNCVIFKKVSK